RPAPQQILGNLVFFFALSAPGPKEATMKTLITILTLTLFTIAPAAAESAKSFAPGHHKSVHGASYNAPGHVKKRLHMQSARGIAPGHKKYCQPPAHKDSGCSSSCTGVLVERCSSGRKRLDANRCISDSRGKRAALVCIVSACWIISRPRGGMEPVQ